MPRLPIPGADEGTWGDILNEYLSVEHNADGTLKKAGDISSAQADATQALADLDAHVAAADPHTVYQKESEKDTANGYAGLDANTLVPRALLGTGTLDGTKFLRDDATWQAISLSLTPWTSDIDADGYALSDLNTIATRSTTETITDGTSRTAVNISKSYSHTTTGTISSVTGIQSHTLLANTSTQPVTNMQNVYAASTLQTGAAITNYYGVRSENTRTFGTTTNAYGVYSKVSTGAFSTTTAATALYALIETLAFGATTQGIGLNVVAANANTFNEMIGIRITALSATTTWGMQIGNYNSYHEGKYRIGAETAGSTAAPASRLDVIEPTLGSDVARFSSVSSFGGDPIERIVQGRVLTVFSSAVTLMTIPIPASTAVSIHAYVGARRDDSSSGGTIEDAAFYEIVGTFKNSAGTAVQIGTTTTLVTHESQAGWNCVFGVSGGSAIISVTGALNNSIYWQGTCHVFHFGS